MSVCLLLTVVHINRLDVNAIDFAGAAIIYFILCHFVFLFHYLIPIREFKEKEKKKQTNIFGAWRGLFHCCLLYIL